MRSVLKIGLLVVASGALVVLYLVRFHGMRIERDGSGIKPVISFYQPEKHYAAIERNRAPAPVTPVAAPETPPPPVSEKEQPAVKPYWTDFRGPRRDGRYDEAPISTNWPAQGPPRLWRKPVGGGYASFVIADGKAYTIEERRHQEVVAAYDLSTGRELWAHGWDGFFQESMGGDGPRATPVWHEGSLYALGAEGELRCLDARTGQRLWSKNILAEENAGNLTWGTAASPLIVDSKLVAVSAQSVVAYDKNTGQRLWRTMNEKQAYASPQLATLGGRRQIFVISASCAAGLNPDDGALLWDYPWKTEYDVNSSQPVIAGPDRFILSAGYDHGAALVELVPSGSRFTARRIWENKRMKNKFTSSVLYEGHIYGLDEAILACVNVATGDLKWKGGRYGHGQILLASGHIVVSAENGDVALVRATPDRHEEIVRFSAIEGKTWNYPALAHGILLVRNTTEMSAFKVN
jgi:outer membrane protein assembly factor BamB